MSSIEATPGEPLTTEKIVAQVKALNLPEHSYIVCGGAMAAAGIRGAADIDLFVSKEAFELLRSRGWEQVQKGNVQPLVRGLIEVHDNWDFGPYSPTLEELLESAVVVDGVPFASLQEVKKWKAIAAWPKDLADIALIDEFLAKRQ